MSQLLQNIVEEETVTCGYCNKVFEVKNMSLDDWNFARDNIVSIDCCNECEPLVAIIDRMYDAIFLNVDGVNHAKV
tara:strand:+ start:2678 stop:2905 length:228 start_codon:yes stop_codon:yes gene_type:complete